MKVKIAAAVLGLFMVSAALVAAQDNTTKTTHKKVRTLSGCLQKGDGSDEYKLTTAKGGTWEVKSDSVKLDEHVGHTVTATGVVSNATMHNMKEDAKDAAKDSGMKKDDSEHGHLKVTAVKMVSESCK